MLINDIIFILRPFTNDKNKCNWTCVLSVDTNIPVWVQNMTMAASTSKGLAIY